MRRKMPGVISPMPGSYAHANWPGLQLLADWRLRKARERDLAVNFVVREEHLWSVARYMPGSLGELDSLGLSGSEIRFHGKTLLALVEKAQTLPEEALPQPMLNLMDMPGYRKAFKAIKSLITDVSETHKISAELLHRVGKSTNC
ncbi:ribonuclease D [Escherichia coli]|uniref:Ribonuclease D n=1 Tax=Escherichia coli TaxID=562 RepID=A0A2X3JYD2_ECOLX|nr:ribonuclease D [Escherichia coli]